jgi:hypothetical protein
MQNRLLIALVASTLLATTALAQDSPNTAMSDTRPAAQANVSSAARAQLTQIGRNRGVAALHVARLSPNVIRGAQVGQDLRFNVAPNVTLTARAVAVDSQPNGMLLWRGEVASTGGMPPGLATLVVSGSNVTGSIRAADGRLFRLRPLADGSTAVVEMNYATMPPDHPAEASRGGGAATLRPNPALQRAPTVIRPDSRIVGPTQNQADANASAAQGDTGASNPRLAFLYRASQLSLIERYRVRPNLIAVLQPPTIDVLVAYTSAAQSAAGDINSLITLAITETNDSFVNSNVWARVRLVGTMSVSYNESSRSYPTMVSHLAGTSDGFMDNVHAQRNATNADVVVLIVNQTQYCGYANDIGATAATAFAVVHHNCATGYYSFAHEIGHLMGARHDPATDPTSTPFAYGHGYRRSASSGGWRTIMAYRCGDSSCEPRLQYWSTPLTTYGGVAMGTEALEHDRRVWNERAATVAAFR